MIGIGCCTSCLAPFYSFPGAVEEIAALGFRTVEVNISGDGMFPADMPDELQKRAFSAIDDSALSVLLHVDLNYIHRRALKEGAEYRRCAEYLLSSLSAWTARLPVAAVTFDAVYGVRRGVFGPLRGWLKKSGLFRGVAGLYLLEEETLFALRYFREAIGRPMTLGFENYAAGMATAGDFAALRRKLGDAWGLLLDIGHAHLSAGRAAAPSLREFIAGITVPIVDVHVSDNDGTADQHLPPGEGTVDWNAALSALAGTGYRGSIMLELAGNSAPAVKKALLASRRMIETILLRA